MPIIVRRILRLVHGQKYTEIKNNLEKNTGCKGADIITILEGELPFFFVIMI